MKCRRLIGGFCDSLGLTLWFNDVYCVLARLHYLWRFKTAETRLACKGTNPYTKVRRVGSSTRLAASRLYCLMSKKTAKSNIRRSKTAWIQTTDYIHLYTWYDAAMLVATFHELHGAYSETWDAGRFPVVFTAADRDQLSVGGLRRADWLAVRHRRFSGIGAKMRRFVQIRLRFWLNSQMDELLRKRVEGGWKRKAFDPICCTTTCLETGFNSCTWYYLGLQPVMHKSLLDVLAGGQGRMMVCWFLWGIFL